MQLLVTHFFSLLWMNREQYVDDVPHSITFKNCSRSFCREFVHNDFVPQILWVIAYVLPQFLPLELLALLDSVFKILVGVSKIFRS